ncbi:Nucleoporin NUP145 (Nuclear pore protein NUP145) [Cleaved into: Nucleoporin NUP145N (N-NUP145), partial [Durusdinium trenchii]
MAKYVGQEHTMYLKICKKYSVQPEPEIKADGGAAGGLFGSAAAPSAGGLFGSPSSGASSGGAASGGSGGLFGGGGSGSSSSLFGSSSLGASSGGLFGSSGSAAGGLFGASSSSFSADSFSGASSSGIGGLSGAGTSATTLGSGGGSLFSAGSGSSFGEAGAASATAFRGIPSETAKTGLTEEAKTAPSVGMPLESATPAPKADSKELKSKHANAEKILEDLRKSKTKVLEELLPCFEALEKELTEVEGLEIIKPSKHADWNSITKACKDLEDDHARVRQDLKEMNELDRPKIFADLIDLQVETLQRHTCFMTEKSPVDSADTPHLKAIRNRCKQVEAELSFLEQDILEKFRNQVDWEGLAQLPTDPRSQAMAPTPLVEAALEKLPGYTGKYVHFEPTRSNIAEPPRCGRWLLTSGRPRNPLRHRAGQKSLKDALAE